MKTWKRKNYIVKEVEYDYDLHQFEIWKNNELITIINPNSLENQAQIIADLNSGHDINGWEDGMGNTISI